MKKINHFYVKLWILLKGCAGLMMTMVQLDLCCIMLCKVHCKALFAQNKCFITIAICPDHPLTLECAQVLLVCIVGGSKHCLVPLHFLWYHGILIHIMSGVMSQWWTILFSYDFLYVLLVVVTINVELQW